MAFRALKSMAHDDEDLYDLAKGMPDDYEPPEYPQGLSFSLSREDLEKIGGKGGEPGQTLRFSAMCCVSSLFRGIDSSRIELAVEMLAGDDGKYFDVEDEPFPPTICLTGSELDKLGLEADAERGDLLHLFGTARLDSLSDTGYGGPRACLQITELDYEDESDEARER